RSIITILRYCHCTLSIVLPSILYSTFWDPLPLYLVTPNNFLVNFFLFYFFPSASWRLPFLLIYFYSFFNQLVIFSITVSVLLLFLSQLLCIPLSKRSLLICVIIIHVN